MALTSVLAQNILHLANNEDWETLDPAYAAGVDTGAMVAKLFDGLMRYDYDSTKVVPDLAEKVTVNDNSTVFTFKLHSGVTFHDGTPLTADAVKYSFERVLDPKTASPVAWVLKDPGIVGTQDFIDGKADHVSGIKVVDPLTIQITLEKPYAVFLYHLAMPAASIVDPAVAQKLGKDFSENPVGTGPFSLEGRVRDSSLTLKAYPDYFAGVPKLDGIKYRIITDPLIEWQEFLAGNLDVASIPEANFLDIINNPKYADMIQKTPELAVYYWAMNERFRPFQDVRVRRAVAMAIDRQGLIDGIYNGTDELANGPIPPGLSSFDPSLKGIPYDPEKAKQLLAEAGYPNGFDLKVWSTRTDTTVAVNNLIQNFLAQVGIRVTINQVDFGTLIDAAINGRASAFYLSWFADYADGYNFLYPLYVADGSQRYAYSNPKVAALLQKAITLPNLDDRIPLYQQAQKLIVQDVPVVYIRYPVSYYAVRPGVTGILNHPIFNADKFMRVEIHQE
jgi:peptide/nickel transport system substrate-binding protein/oligopeptide transport system substrate-binding protein